LGGPGMLLASRAVLVSAGRMFLAFSVPPMVEMVSGLAVMVRRSFVVASGSMMMVARRVF